MGGRGQDFSALWFLFSFCCRQVGPEGLPYIVGVDGPIRLSFFCVMPLALDVFKTTKLPIIGHKPGSMSYQQR